MLRFLSRGCIAERPSAICNNDGRIDIVVSTINDKPQMLMNRTANGNHWIFSSWWARKDNRDGLGTKVKIVTAEGAQCNHATTAVGYSSSSDKRVHFGLGKAAIDRHGSNCRGPRA